MNGNSQGRGGGRVDDRLASRVAVPDGIAALVAEADVHHHLRYQINDCNWDSIHSSPNVKSLSEGTVVSRYMGKIPCWG